MAKGKGKRKHARRSRLAVRTKRRVAKRRATKATPRKRPQKGKGHGRRDWRPRFLKTLRRTGVVGLAARAAGISRQHAYRVAKEQPEFRAEWVELEQAALDDLEASILRRAAKDRVLAIFILKSKRRSIYGDRPTAPVLPNVYLDNIPKDSPGNPA